MAKYQWRSFTIQPNGEVIETVHPKQPEYTWLRSQVEGYIETVPYFTKYKGRTRGTAYCNEEGWLKGMPINSPATWAWKAQFSGGSLLVGPVVITFREKKS